MQEDAQVTMLLYRNLRPEEEKVLRELERNVVETLLTNGITGRPFWEADSKAGERIVCLVLPTKTVPRVLAEIPKSQLGSLSQDRLISMINESIGRN